jgi:phospholipid/cholesterol/gamma-HCH transport system permease protein
VTHLNRKKARLSELLDRLAARLRSILEEAGELATLAGRAVWELAKPPYDVRAWIAQAEQIGVRSLGVACVTTIFTGMVMALQTALSLPGLGVKYYIGTVVSKSLTRELGPVLVALIVGGRIGAGMTAELGTMKVTEQIDAMRAMAADPIKKLVAPKLAASLVMMPCLVILGDALGILGGLLIGVMQLQLPAGLYINDVLSSLTIGDVTSGVGKSIFFAFFITIVACHQGLKARGGADGVGRATTNTVVMASIFVLISDFFLTKLFFIFG